MLHKQTNQTKTTLNTREVSSYQDTGAHRKSAENGLNGEVEIETGHVRRELQNKPRSN